MKRSALLVVGFVWLWAAHVASAQTAAPEITFPAQTAVSQPLREGTDDSQRGDRKVHNHQPLRHRDAGPNVSDSALAPLASSGSQSSVTASFPGVGVNGLAPVAPADANMAVGPNRILQTVNSRYAIYDKNGVLLVGPNSLSSLWAPLGNNNGCATNNGGDVVALYDKPANRFIVTQLGGVSAPFSECIAISQTSDPGGAYYLYSFDYGTTLNDYPKFGVWPTAHNSAYLATYNLFDNGATFIGAQLCAYDRAKMLVGDQTAASICYTINGDDGFLPTDVDGPTPPLDNTPGYFLNLETSSSLRLYALAPNFSNPNASSLSVETPDIAVAGFLGACAPTYTCVPQLGTTQQLDSLGDRLMYRLAFRNFGDHEVLVANHSVNIGSSVGVRWYELRAPVSTSGAFTLFQQGTYAPDSTYRWMGSIAMDAAGNIGLGYSASSSSIHPAIRYAGRVPGDPAGTLQAEVSLIEGPGSQTGGLSRWGDYSAMQIDPADNCTFWYTNEYLPANGSFNWSTFFGAFKFPSCGTGTQADLTITKTHSGAFARGQTGATYTLKVSNSGSGPTTGTVTVSDTLPAGLTATAIAGTGWTCTQPAGPCTRSDALAGGSSYPVITLTVNVASNAPASVTNTANVSGGGETNTANDTASDITAIGTAIRINAGGPAFTGTTGTWVADTNFSGGKTYSKVVAIAGTVDDTLYQTERYGNFSYNITLPNGPYTVTLRFAELYWTATGKRIFNVAIEGQTVLSNFDIFAAAGANTALDRTFQTTVADGTLNIVFTTSVDNAKVSAIEVIAAGAPTNQAPVVNAGMDKVITLPTNSVALSGTATDDGLPTPPGSVTYAWSQVSGPAGVTFSAPTSLATNATFPGAGTYTLRLTANDSALSGSDDVIVTVNSTPVNTAPVANAGTDKSITLPTSSVALTGSATDDGLPSPPGALTYAWTMFSGPAAVTFSAPTSPSTNATFTTAGTYTLRLSVSDSALTGTDDVIVTVNPASSFTPVRINAGGPAFTDSLSQVWAADKNFSGGTTYSKVVAIAGTVDDTLFQTERYGNFSYNIAVPAGTYTVMLRFAELYWTATGKRVFSVAIEGQTVLSNFDIFATAGANTALDRTFQTTVSDGTLNIVFTTSVDNAKVSAIQVTQGQALPTYNLSGAISGGGLSTVTLSGAAGGTTTADGAGNYSFSGLANGSYTVTPSKTGSAFTPASANVTINGANMSGINFTAMGAPTVTISGTVTSAGSGAIVKLVGPQNMTATADAGGNYSFTGVVNGSYAVTPSAASADFNPSTRNVTVNGASVTGVNFTATATANTIFFDNFSAGSLNSAWAVVSRHGEYAQDETECNTASQVSQANGYLTITAIAQSTSCGDFNIDGSVRHAPATWPYATGDIQWRTFNFTYGSVTIRTKFPTQSTGTWPATWLLGSNCQVTNIYTADTGYSTCPGLGASGYTEIDLTECFGSQWCQTNVANPSFGACQISYPTSPDGNWHTYKTVWNSTSISQYMDGVLQTQCNQNLSKPMFLIIQIQTGGVGGTPNNSLLPANLVVDYVKVTN